VLLRIGVTAPKHDRGQVTTLVIVKWRRGSEDLSRELLEPDDSALTLQLGEAVRVGITAAVLGSDLRAETVLAGCHEGLLGRARAISLPRSDSRTPGNGGRDGARRSCRTTKTYTSVIT
jgi:hypothetical protein